MSALEVSELSLQLGGKWLLDRISARFGRGRVTVLLGSNGAGKSSLLACIAGLRLPTRGGATLDGVPLGALPRLLRAQRIGYLEQTADVHWNVDVRSLVALGRFPHSRRWAQSQEDCEAIENAMAATDVTTLAERPVEELSGGERGRVLLARVLAGEPDWLLVDEPLAGLDPAHQFDSLDLLRAAAERGQGVVIVLHDLHLARRVADDAILLRCGRLIAAGAADEVLTPARLSETYDVVVEAGRTAAGHDFLLPVGRP